MEKHNSDDKVFFGFWVYLMTDLLIFAALFATFAVLRNNTFGGITIREIFDPPAVLTETLILLTSSFVMGLAIVSLNYKKKFFTIFFLILTFILGLMFLEMEFSEFIHIIEQGYSWQTSAFLSSFFTLVGTHGLHIAAGLVWMGILIIQILRRGITTGNLRKVRLLSLFWHFLDIVWIFIFTIVYLMSGI